MISDRLSDADRLPSSLIARRSNTLEHQIHIHRFSYGLLSKLKFTELAPLTLAQMVHGFYAIAAFIHPGEVCTEIARTRRDSTLIPSRICEEIKLNKVIKWI